jgi:hypothetical protein
VPFPNPAERLCPAGSNYARPAVFFSYSTMICPYIHGCGVQM